MNVLMVSHLYPSREDSVNGSFVHSQVKALKDLRVSVQVIAPSPFAPIPLTLFSTKWNKYSRIPSQDTLENVDVVYPRIIRTPRALLFQYAGAWYYRALKDLAARLHRQKPFTMVHAQVGYPDGWAAVRIAQDLGVPCLITCHGQELLLIVNQSRQLKELVSGTLFAAHHVIVASERMHQLALQLGLPEDKLTLLANGLDIMPQAPLPKEFTKQLAGKKVMLSVSYLNPQKGNLYNLEAVATLKDKYPNLVYIAVGEGPQAEELITRARLLGISDRLLLSGQVPHSLLGGYYQAADVFSMPSRGEAFGMVYLEAMQHGVPVIGCEAEGLTPEFCARGAGYAVPWADPAAIAQAVDKVLSNPEEAKKMGEQGVKMATGFSWQDNAAKLLDLYNQVLEKGQ